MIFRKKSGPIDLLIVGLGNPGKAYENTRHNAGAIALSALADKCGVSLTRSKFHALTAEATVSGVRALLLFPQTFMNLSGEAVAEAAKFYKIPPERIVVLSDDVALAVGQVRVRRKGSDGGQKGLRSIVDHLGTSDFPRVRIGVGQKPHPEMELADWVLSRFSSAERRLIDDAADRAARAVELIALGEIDRAMNEFSR